MKKVVLIIAAAILSFITINGAITGGNKGKLNESENKGREYLLKLEERDLNTIESEIDEFKDSYYIDTNKKNEESEGIGGKNYSKYYKDTIFMGDSIMEALSEFDVINDYNVLSTKGDTVVKATSKVDKLKNLNPKNIVLLYGMNDVIEFDGEIPGKNEDMFKEKYTELLNKIKEALPSANIYIMSPLPVLDNAVKTNKRLTNNNLDKFKVKVEETAVETGSIYVDISGLVKGKEILYEGDGIHLKYDFYTIWLDYLKKYISN
ncbi:GDSL-type esterase/lipase family protein [Clostridium paraputrificum]|uniref:GDSL-type esterase/lipase family protein n=1 Tax=Clostridium TaxID=1485 RepID=UPI003D336167